MVTAPRPAPPPCRVGNGNSPPETKLAGLPLMASTLGSARISSSRLRLQRPDGGAQVEVAPEQEHVQRVGHGEARSCRLDLVTRGRRELPGADRCRPC